MLMNSAGNSSSWGWDSMVRRPSLHMEPQDGVGGTTPMPIKDRKASMKMAVGMAKVRDTSSTPMTFGSI